LSGKGTNAVTDTRHDLLVNFKYGLGQVLNEKCSPEESIFRFHTKAWYDSDIDIIFYLTGWFSTLFLRKRAA
jgi:hypothetical protein